MDRKTLTWNSATVLKYLRKTSKISQSKLSKLIGCSRSHLSRLEIGQKELLLVQVSALAEYFKVDIRSFLHGLVDVETKNDIEILRIPTWLTKNANINGYAVNAFLSYFQKTAGKREVKNYLKDEKLDSLYFINCRNCVNIYFVLRMLQRMKKLKCLTSKSKVQNLASHFYSFLKMHEQVGESLVLRGQLITAAIDELMQYFIGDFLYVVTLRRSHEATISIAPRDHVDSKLFLHDPILKDSFLEFFAELFVCASDGKLSCDWQRSEASVKYQLRVIS